MNARPQFRRPGPRRRTVRITHAFCEPVTATDVSPWHIRPVAKGEALRFGGGLDVDALCGRTFNGWDLPTAVTPDIVTRLLGRETNPPCRVCADAYLRAT